MCVEAYFINKYPTKKWDIIVEKLWEITNLELWDKWMDEVIEIIPEYLFEFPDFEYLSKEKYLELKSVYEGIDKDVNNILKLFYQLANAHVYSSINGYGKESLEMLEKIIQFLINNNIELPSDLEIMNYKLDEKNGWGEVFDGIKLSKIIN